MMQQTGNYSLDPVCVWGIKSDFKPNILFLNERKVIFAAGHNLVEFNIDEKEDRTQKFIPGIEGSDGITAMALSQSGSLLAVAEKGEHAICRVFDTKTMKLKKVVTSGEYVSQEFVSMAFAPGTKERNYLITLCGPPDWNLIYWQWDKPRCIHYQNLGKKHTIYQCSFHPTDENSIVVTGNSTFKFYKLQDGILKAHKSQIEKKEQHISMHYTCHLWIEGRLLVCTDQGEILLLDSSGEYKMLLDQSPQDGSAIHCITQISKGFVIGCDGSIIQFFEKTDDHKHPFKRIGGKAVKEGDAPVISTPVRSIVRTPTADDLLVISLGNNQVYRASLSVEIIDDMKFKLLTYDFHSSAITGMDICIRKPLVATCSSDQSVRVWNYQDKTLEIKQVFPEEALSLAFHPSGFHLIVGFADRIRLMNVFKGQLSVFKDIPIKGCRELQFCHGGHLFAACSGQNIHVYNFYTGENPPNMIFKGHESKVTSISWEEDDSGFCSAGWNGAVYKWKLSPSPTDNKGPFFLQKGINLSCVLQSPLPDGHVYTVASDKQIKEIVSNSEKFYRECGTILGQICLSRDSKIFFGGVADNQKPGSIRCYNFDPQLTGVYNEIQAHSQMVTRLRVSPDDKHLFSSSQDGTLMMFQIKQKDEPHAKKDKDEIALQFSDEILCNKKDLESLNDQITKLTKQYNDQHEINEKQIKLKTEKNQKEINRLTREIERVKEETEEKERMLCAKKDEMKQMYREKYIQRENEQRKIMLKERDKNAKKLSEEQNRYSELTKRAEDEATDFKKQSQEAREEHESRLEELNEEHTLTLEAQKKETQTLLQLKDELKDKHADGRREREKNTEDDINKKKIVNNAKLSELSSTVRNNREDLRITKNDLRKHQTDIDKFKREIKKKEDDLTEQMATNKGLKEEIKRQQQEIDQRIETIKEKKERRFDLKKKTQELEKFRFVLDYKIKELKKDIEPKQNQIQQLTEQTTKMDGELKSFKRINGNLYLIVADLKLKQEGMENEIHDQKKKLDLDAIFIRKFREDISKCFRDDVKSYYKVLKNELIELHKKYVKDVKDVKDDVKKMTDASVDKQKIKMERRKYLENSVKSLEEKLVKDAWAHRKDNVKLMSQNVELIQQINELRKDIRYNEKTSEGLGSGKLMKQSTRGSRAGGSTKRSVDRTPRDSHMMEKDKEIDMQHMELDRLREELQIQEEENRLLMEAKPMTHLRQVEGEGDEGEEMEGEGMGDQDLDESPQIEGGALMEDTQEVLQVVEREIVSSREEVIREEIIREEVIIGEEARVEEVGEEARVESEGHLDEKAEEEGHLDEKAGEVEPSKTGEPSESHTPQDLPEKLGEDEIVPIEPKMEAEEEIEKEETKAEQEEVPVDVPAVQPPKESETETETVPEEK